MEIESRQSSQSRGQRVKGSQQLIYKEKRRGKCNCNKERSGLIRKKVQFRLPGSWVLQIGNQPCSCLAVAFPGIDRNKQVSALGVSRSQHVSLELESLVFSYVLQVLFYCIAFQIPSKYCQGRKGKAKFKGDAIRGKAADMSDSSSESAVSKQSRSRNASFLDFEQGNNPL